jgi:photosystem II stability/assembly factor-like uncharacterized protein
MSDRILVGTRKGLFDLRRGESRWGIHKVHFLGDPVSAVLRDPLSGALYAALALGHFGVKLWMSADDGATWIERPAPAFPPRPEGLDDPHPWTVHSIWILENGGVPGRLWAGTIAGGLFRSDDAGGSWQLVRSLWDRPERREWFGGGADHPGIHSVCVDPRFSDRIVVGVSCGGVWMSEDGGATWQLGGKGIYAEFMPPERRDDPRIQDVHRIVQCAALPDTLWCQHHNGVFHSQDRGVTWREITTIKPSKFGFAVAVHPSDPRSAWFVPAVKDECRVPVDGKLVVARTRDSGESFDTLSAGLPDVPAYDLIYRHALAVDGSGRRLAMGSTTGGLWLTEDGGDTWFEFPARLPPIACLRFAVETA